MEERLPRKLAAILHADVAGYSRLAGEDEDTTHRRLKESLGLISRKVTGCHGHVINTAGDAVLAMFGAVVDAVSCAVEIQQNLATLNQDTPDKRKVQFRIGVNSGDVIEDSGDIYGDGVNVAARLQGLAEPGGICISDAVRSAVGRKLDLGYEFMGEQEVKNITEPVRAYRVLLEPDKREGSTTGFTAIEPSEKPSMAVLPFSDLSEDSSKHHLAMGLAEELITTLGSIPWFFVSASSVSLSKEFAGASKKELGAILGVRYLISGNVQSSKEKIRVTVYLTNSESGQQIWAEKFEGIQDDLFEVQDRIAKTVIGAIEPKMLEMEILRSQAKHGNLTAFDYYLQALAHIREMGETDLKQSLALLQLAIQSNPKYAAAHGLISWLMTLQVPQGLGFDVQAGLAHAQKALQYGRDDADALSTGGYGLGFLSFDPGAGLVYLEESLKLNPNSARANDFAGWLQCYAGNIDEALIHFDKSINLSRIDAFTFRALSGKAFSLFFLGRFTEAAEFAKRSIISNPRFTPSHRVLAASLVHCDQIDEARSVVKSLLEQVDGLTISRYSKETRFSNLEQKQILLDSLSEAGLPID